MSQRLRLALIIALAVPTAYGIALSMAWEEPHWAGLAIAMCGLATMGESIFRALQRLAGTFIAIAVALALLATLTQHRWSYGIAVSLWLAFCTWRLLNTERYYFWYCAGFIVPLLSMASHFDSAMSFYIVTTRAKETVLGILCYIGYALLLMPRDAARQRFEDLVRKQLDLMRQKIEDIHDHARDLDRSPDARRRGEQIAQGMSTLATMRQAAAVESFQIRERSRAWREFIRELDRLDTMLDRLDLSFALEGGRAQREETTALEATLDEFAARIEAVGAILLMHGPGREPQPLAQLATEREVSAARPFHEGGILLQRDTLEELDRTTRELNSWALDLVDARRRPEPPRRVEPLTFLPDPEPLRLAFWQFMTFWAAFLTYIYVPALPVGPIVVILGAVLAMNLVRLPWAPPGVLFLAILVACFYAGIAHVFVMPQLPGFVGLAAMMFCFIFLIVWLFHTAEQQPSRSLGIALFMLCIQVNNTDQRYNATYIMNIVVTAGILVLLLHLLHFAPLSWRPQAVIARLLRRYAASMASLLEGMRWDLPATNTWLARQRRHYHQRQIRMLPAQIGNWIGHLPEGAIGADGHAALGQLADRLAVLSHRLADLARLRAIAADPALVLLLGEEVRNWRLAIQQTVRELAHHPESVDEPHLRDRLEAMIVRLEERIAAAVDGGDTVADPAGIAHMQRVLSAYRGVSDALISAAARARGIAWQQLAEARF